jgi:hypothetical protein
MAVIFFIAAALMLSGCIVGDIDILYSLPQTQEKYQQLQQLIDAELEAGSEYSAPTGGSLRQSVQLVEINGDGVEEAVVFLRDENRTPEICVYKQDGGLYTLAYKLTGQGSSIGHVEYADLNGDGSQELIVSWEDNDLATVMAYSLRIGPAEILLTVSCTDFLVGQIYADGDDEELERNIVATLNMSGKRGVVELFFTDGNRNVERTQAELSEAMVTADRFRLSRISGGTDAVIVEGHFQDAGGVKYLTDVLVLDGKSLENVALQQGNKSAPVRDVYVFSRDINGDGAIDVPYPMPIYGGENYYLLDWMTFDAQGGVYLCATTYHDIGQGWYYVLPLEWRDGFSVSYDGERVTFYTGGEQEVELLRIYVFSGENRNESAALPGRFVLARSGTIIYAAMFPPGSGEYNQKSRDEVIDRFNIITTEWDAGIV